MYLSLHPARLSANLMLIYKNPPHEMLKKLQHSKCSSRQKDGVGLNKEEPVKLGEAAGRRTDGGEDVGMNGLWAEGGGSSSPVL